MAPSESSSPKGKTREKGSRLDFGKKGRYVNVRRVVGNSYTYKYNRKTGIEVPDTGIRDEYGLEPMDNLFSSPEKVQRSNGANKNANTTISSEEEMDLGQSTSRQILFLARTAQIRKTLY